MIKLPSLAASFAGPFVRLFTPLCLFALTTAAQSTTPPAQTDAAAQSKTLSYAESKADILNPERGFYIPVQTKASHFVLLDSDHLRAFRNDPQHPRKASYTLRVSLVYRSYELDTFKNQPLSPAFLTNLQSDFDAVRIAGLKMILRFAYTDAAHGGDCKNEYGVCPPYGDAPRNIVMNHIQQLKPLLRKNADIIAVMQEGFIGIWGENYFSDYFGDASTNGTGRIGDSSWLQRNELLQALLDAMPADRMVQVRTPQIKQKFVNGPAATVHSLPLSATTAYNRSCPSRIGFHNDCFLSGPDDYGTFYDIGSSSQPRQPANAVLREYTEADTRYTAVGGETCDDAYSPQNDCAPGGSAETAMRRMHYSFLNATYNTDVTNDWDSGGCMPAIQRNLGYRFVLRKARWPLQVKTASSGGNPASPDNAGAGSLSLDLTLENTGYAAPYNPRPVRLIFRSTAGKGHQAGKRDMTNKPDTLAKREWIITLSANPQYWFSGMHHIRETIHLPAAMPPGSYQLFVCLPDASAGLSKRPEYSIQFANENIWEETTGYNDLRHIVLVK